MGLAPPPLSHVHPPLGSPLPYPPTHPLPPGPRRAHLQYKTHTISFNLPGYPATKPPKARMAIRGVYRYQGSAAVGSPCGPQGPYDDVDDLIVTVLPPPFGPV